MYNNQQLVGPNLIKWFFRLIREKKKTHAAAEFGAVKVVRLRQLGPLQMRIRKKNIEI